MAWPHEVAAVPGNLQQACNCWKPIAHEKIISDELKFDAVCTDNAALVYDKQSSKDASAITRLRKSLNRANEGSPRLCICARVERNTP